MCRIKQNKRYDKLSFHYHSVNYRELDLKLISFFQVFYFILIFKKSFSYFTLNTPNFNPNTWDSIDFSKYSWHFLFRFNRFIDSCCHFKHLFEKIFDIHFYTSFFRKIEAYKRTKLNFQQIILIIINHNSIIFLILKDENISTMKCVPLLRFSCDFSLVVCSCIFIKK